MEGPIRLMTANLLNDRADLVDLARVLDTTKPDLVVTQELGPDAASLLGERFPHHMLRPAADHKGRGIASRFPAEFGVVPLTWRPGMWARMTIGSAQLVLATVHIRNAVTPPWWRSVRIRGLQVEELYRWADEFVGVEDHLVIAGDMNATPAWPVYRRMVERWPDLVADAAEDDGAKPELTWAWRPGWPRMLRIDHVFGSRVRVVQTRVEPVRGSDHAAVVVDLELGGAALP